MGLNLKVVALMAALAALGACSKTDTGAATGSGATATSGSVTPGSQEDLVANVGDRVFYALDSSTLSSEARTTLDRQAAWLARFPAISVQLGGNCDERGTTEYNLALGENRANAAKMALTSAGVSASRIRVVSYGKEKQFCTEQAESCYQQNRRAQFLLDK